MPLSPIPAPSGAPVVLHGGLTFDWHHVGSPDLQDPVVVSVLAHDLPVVLSDVNHTFVTATPCLHWRDVPGALPTDPPVGKSIP